MWIPIVGMLALGAWMLTRQDDEQLSPNFRLSEFAVSSSFPGLATLPRGAAKENIRRGVRGVLQPLRDDLGVPITITSAYRSEALNQAIGGALHSFHMAGLAADIKADGYTDEELIAILWDLVQAGELPGIGEVITYDDTTHLHISWAGPQKWLRAYRDENGRRTYERWNP